MADWKKSIIRPASTDSQESVSEPLISQNPHDVLGEHTLGSPADLQRENLQLPRFSRYTASDSLTTVMDRIRNVRARNVLNKLAVSQEEGLTNAQLMLTNHDLKPGQ